MSDNHETLPTYYTAELLDGGTRETIQEAIDGLDARWRAWSDEASRPRAQLILGGTFTLDRAIQLRCPIEIIGVDGGEKALLELRATGRRMACFRFYENEGVNDVTLRHLRIHGYVSDKREEFWGGGMLVARPPRTERNAALMESMLMANVGGWRVEGCELWRCGIAFSRDYGFVRDISIIDTEIHDYEGIGILIEGIQNVMIDNCSVHDIRKFGVKNGEKIVRNDTFGCGLKLRNRYFAPDTTPFDATTVTANPPLAMATWSHEGEVVAQFPCSRTQYLTVQNSRIYNCQDDGIGAMIADFSIINCEIYDNDENGIESKTSGKFLVDGQWVDGEWDIIENARLVNNHVHGNGTPSDVYPHGMNGIICSVSGTLLLGNVSENNGNDGIQVSRMKGRRTLHNITVVGNRSLGNGGDGIQLMEQETKTTDRVRIVGNEVRGNGGYGMSVGKSRFIQVGIMNLDDVMYHQWADGTFLSDVNGVPSPIGSCREWMSKMEPGYAEWSNVLINNARGGIHLQKSEEADIFSNWVQSDAKSEHKRIGIDANQTKAPTLRGNRCVGQEMGMSANFSLNCCLESNQLDGNETNLSLHESNLESFSGNVLGESLGKRSVIAVRVTGIDISEETIKQQNKVAGRVVVQV